MSDNLIRESSSIRSSYDFELSIKRENDVVYNYTYPKNKKVEGIVFVIPGFGEDTNSEYSQMLRDHVASKFNVIAVSVIYHCFYSRLSNGATQFLDQSDQDMLIRNVKHFNITSVPKDLNEILFTINNKVQTLKDNGELADNISVFQTMTLQPKNNEYQNFGILQALDHINVLKDIRKKQFSFIDKYPTILMGSSHGGYIANLMAKIIPNAVDCVIDNSSYIKPPLNYIVGKENDFLSPEFVISYGKNVFVHLFTKTMWTKDENSFYHFSKDRYDIRDLSNKTHNEKAAKISNSNTKYISYHSVTDAIAPYEDKKGFYEQLSELGFDVKLKSISESSEIDGSFIKSLKHGLDMSIKQLANKELPDALKIKSDSSEHSIESISYQCESENYNFEDINGVFSAEISPVKNIEDTIVETFNKNMEYFEQNQPNIYSKLASFDSAVEQGLYTNKYDMVFNNNYFDVRELSTNKYLYSDNSNKYAYEVSKKFDNSVDKFIFFGIGLGLHIDQIDKKVNAKSYLIIEDDLELFKLSTFITPYYELVKRSELYFSVFEGDEEFSNIVTEFFDDLKGSEKTVSHFEMNNNYKNKIFLLNDTIGKLNV